MVVMGVLLVDSLLLLGCNLLTDALIAFVDPRIRFK
jgi:ABC-type dipeptide/oligopeptide/nickel transport system permease component